MFSAKTNGDQPEFARYTAGFLLPKIMIAFRSKELLITGHCHGLPAGLAWLVATCYQQLFVLDGGKQMDCITRKLSYPDEVSAEKAASRTLHRKGITLYSYLCQYCQTFHLTKDKPADVPLLVDAVLSGKATPVAKLSKYVTRFKYSTEDGEYVFLYLRRYKKVRIEKSASSDDQLVAAVRANKAKFLERLTPRYARFEYLASDGYLYTFKYDKKHGAAHVEKREVGEVAGMTDDSDTLDDMADDMVQEEHLAETPNRYLIFSGGEHPQGGWEDYRGTTATLLDALAMVNSLDYEERHWWHVVDTATMAIVEGLPYDYNSYRDE